MGKQVKRCVIFGAAPVENVVFLQGVFRNDDWFIVADGGVDLAEKCGVTPHLLVADYDSSTPVSDVESIRLPVEKDVTDTCAAMEIAFEKGYRDFLLVGCTGGRMDHTIANLLCMRRFTEKGCAVQMIDSHNKMTVLLPGTYSLSDDFSAGFSVFSLSEKSENLCLFGVQYPLHGYTLQADDSLCVSNRVISENAGISFDSGVVVLIFSKD